MTSCVPQINSHDVVSTGFELRITNVTTTLMVVILSRKRWGCYHETTKGSLMVAFCSWVREVIVGERWGCLIEACCSWVREVVGGIPCQSQVKDFGTGSHTSLNNRHHIRERGMYRWRGVLNDTSKWDEMLIPVGCYFCELLAYHWLSVSDRFKVRLSH